MNFRQSVLVGLLVVGVAVGAAMYVHPDGVDGVLRMVGLGGLAASESAPEAEAHPKPTHFDSLKAAGDQLTEADSAYDSGNFDRAVTCYTVAKGLASDDALRARATTGLQRAVLAWALTLDAPTPEFGGRLARERFAELRETARSAATEDAWLELALFAKAAGLDSEAPAAVSTALDLAVAHGPVERRIHEVLPRAKQREAALREALTLRGLDGALRVPTGTAGLHHAPHESEEPSGIGGTGTVARIAVPFGSFSPATRTKLKRAVEAEREGLVHFAAAGPEGTDRAEHRAAALKLLREARDLYSAALDEDPESSAAEARLRHVMRALGQLNKEVVTGD